MLSYKALFIWKSGCGYVRWPASSLTLFQYICARVLSNTFTHPYIHVSVKLHCTGWNEIGSGSVRLCQQCNQSLSSGFRISILISPSLQYNPMIRCNTIHFSIWGNIKQCHCCGDTQYNITWLLQLHYSRTLPLPENNHGKLKLMVSFNWSMKLMVVLDN